MYEDTYRERKPWRYLYFDLWVPNGYADFARKSNQVYTMTLEGALQWAGKTRWKIEIDEKLKSLKRAKKWGTVYQPRDVQVVPYKWVCKLKRNADGTSMHIQPREHYVEVWMKLIWLFHYYLRLTFCYKINAHPSCSKRIEHSWSWLQ